mmetsp:Transcript_23964/g.18290  ORF Transcript_23964/g.18290 Transcript_23964/m.18290 type:complete len:89 (-) Transcript_23964:368-634(-)
MQVLLHLDFSNGGGRIEKMLQILIEQGKLSSGNHQFSQGNCISPMKTSSSSSKSTVIEIASEDLNRELEKKLSVSKEKRLDMERRLDD